MAYARYGTCLLYVARKGKYAAPWVESREAVHGARACLSAARVYDHLISQCQEVMCKSISQALGRSCYYYLHQHTVSLEVHVGKERNAHCL